MESQEVSLSGTVDQDDTSQLFRPDGIPPAPQYGNLKSVPNVETS